MNKYVSISRSFRGFDYKTDYDFSTDWIDYIQHQSKTNNEIEWSVLINTHSGLPIMKYSRGMPILNMKCELY